MNKDSSIQHQAGFRFGPTRTAVVAFLVIGVLTVILVTWVNLPWRPDVKPLPSDSGFYAYIGKAILHGQVLYKDVWDDKPPLGYYLNALMLLIFGQTTWGLWWSGIAWISGVAFLLISIFKKLFGWITACSAAILFLIALMHPELFQGGNMMEVFALAPQIGLIGITYLCFTKRKLPWHVFLVGVLTAITYLIKQPTIVLGAASIFLIAISSLSERKLRQSIKEAVWFGLGFICLTVLVALYWFIVGDLRDFIDGAILQGVSFIGGTQSTFREYFFYTLVKVLPTLRLGSLYLVAMLSSGIFLVDKLYQFWLKPILRERLSWLEWCLIGLLLAFPVFASWMWPHSYLGKFWLASISLLGLFFILKFYRLKTRPRNEKVFTPLEWTWLMAVIALPFEVLMASLGGRYFGHYFITMIPAVILALAYPFWRLISGVQSALKSRASGVSLIAYCIPILLTIPWAIKSFPTIVPSGQYTDNLSAIFKNQSTANNLEKYIIETTQPDDEVLVWHIHLGINFVTDRKAPSRFLFPLNLFIPPTKENTRLKEYIDELEAHPPELILVQKVSSLAIPFVDQPIETACDVYCGPEFVQALEVPQINQQWHRLQEFFYAHYSEDTHIYDWTVYRKLP